MNSRARNENAAKRQKRQQRRDITNERSERAPPTTESEVYACYDHSECSSILHHPAHSKKRNTPWHRYRTRSGNEKSKDSDQLADLGDKSSDSDQETGAPVRRPRNKVARLSYSKYPRIRSQPLYSIKPMCMECQSSKFRRAGQDGREKIGSSECPQSQDRPLSPSMPKSRPPPYLAKPYQRKSNTPHDELKLGQRFDVDPLEIKPKRARSPGKNPFHSPECATSPKTPKSSYRPSLVEVCVQKSIDVCSQFVEAPTARSNEHTDETLKKVVHNCRQDDNSKSEPLRSMVPHKTVSCGENLQLTKFSPPLSSYLESNNDDPLCEEIVLDGSHMHPPDRYTNKYTIARRKSLRKLAETRSKRARSKSSVIPVINLDSDKAYNKVLENAPSSNERQQKLDLTARPSVTFANNAPKEVCRTGLESQPSCSESMGEDVEDTTINKIDIKSSSAMLEVGSGSPNREDKCEADRKTIQLLDIDTFSEGDLDDELRAMIEEFNRSDDEVRLGVDPSQRQNCIKPSERVSMTPGLEAEEKGKIIFLDDIEVRKTNHSDNNISRSKLSTGNRSKTSSVADARKRRKAFEAAPEKSATARKEGETSSIHPDLPTKESRVEILWEDRDQVFSGRLGKLLEKKDCTFEVYYDDGHVIIEKLNDVHWRYEPTQVQANEGRQDVGPKRPNEGEWFKPGDLYQLGSENSESGTDSSFEP